MTKREALFERYKNIVCAAAYCNARAKVLQRMRDEGMEVDEKLLDECLRDFENYLEKISECRKRLGMPQDTRAFTDTFRFQGFTVKAGFLEGDIANCEAICGPSVMGITDITPDACLRYEVGAIALMYAGGAKVAYTQLEGPVKKKGFLKRLFSAIGRKGKKNGK